MNGNASTQFAAIPQHYMDRRAMPMSGLAPNGRWIDITKDERLPGLWRDYLDDGCLHPETVIVRRINAAGGQFFSRYCPHCGVKWSAMIKRADAEREGIAADLTEHDIDQRAEVYLAARQEDFDKIVNAAAERVFDARPENTPAYQEYLRSPRWRRRAAKIMKRAGGKCEGCLTRDAQEVHHTTYDHIYEEFAFELLALCSQCHRRYHGKAA